VRSFKGFQDRIDAEAVVALGHRDIGTIARSASSVSSLTVRFGFMFGGAVAGGMIAYLPILIPGIVVDARAASAVAGEVAHHVPIWRHPTKKGPLPGPSQEGSPDPTA
jgi:hypothetical protein